MKNKPIPNTCMTCAYLWTHGIKDGVHDRWCCRYGQSAIKVVNHCHLMSGFKPKETK